jgi:uncharacterized membrane-anchored protein
VSSSRASDDRGPRWATAQLGTKVPKITAYFWVAKVLSTAMGEATSDFLVHRFGAPVAVPIGGLALLGALVVQIAARYYFAGRYWLAVAMVGIFGTMAADVLHIGLGVPYYASTAFFALVLAAVFLTWQNAEKTLSIHSIFTRRRELFYWAAVLATFALGTATGDLSATTLHLGYFGSTLVFAVIFAIPGVAYRWFSMNAILAFWFAYVVTRPLGASFADWLGKPRDAGGLALGLGWVSLALSIALGLVVLCFIVTKSDVPESPPATSDIR